MSEFDDSQRLVRSVSAELAVYESSGEQDRWLLRNGSESRFEHGQELVQGSLEPFAERSWDLDLTPDLLQVLIVDPDRMTMSDLDRASTSSLEDVNDYYGITRLERASSTHMEPAAEALSITNLERAASRKLDPQNNIDR